MRARAVVICIRVGWTTVCRDSIVISATKAALLSARSMLCRDTTSAIAGNAVHANRSQESFFIEEGRGAFILTRPDSDWQESIFPWRVAGYASRVESDAPQRLAQLKKTGLSSD